MLPQLNYSEFYITNVCNYNCENCNRFNNYNFSGSSEWKDYYPIYKQWAERIDINKYAILGGEPLTNKDYLNWWKGICELWPNAAGCIITNGTLLKKELKNIYPFLLEAPEKRWLEISTHRHDRSTEIFDLINPVKIETVQGHYGDAFEHLKVSYNKVKDPSWPMLDSINKWHTLPDNIKEECKEVHNLSLDIINAEQNVSWLIDKNGVRFKLKREEYFHQAAVISDCLTQTFTLHNSNPNIAHDVCDSKKCHHWNRGKLYKCGPVDLLKDIDEQFKLLLSPDDRKLLYSYVPASIDMTDGELKTFLTNLDNNLDQCKFCPENLVSKKISPALRNKTIFIKNSK